MWGAVSTADPGVSADAATINMQTPKPNHPFASAQPVTSSHRASSHGQCPICGAPLAADQRYCVECGQRLGPARQPFMGERSGPDEARRRETAHRWWTPTSPNATLIAGVATLLLAMGIGVLIGRSGQGSGDRRGAVQVVTVAGAGGTSEAQGPSGTSTTGKSTSGSGTSAKTASTSSAKGAFVPPKKVVTVGSKGSGPGYQHGHFTGNFFGGESGEEGEEESSGSSGSKPKSGKKK